MTALLDRPGRVADFAMAKLFPAPPRSHPYRDDPVGYCRDILGFDPWSKQQEVLEALRDHNRVAVRSCHGVGKTAAAGGAVNWFHDTRPNSRVISTAPTFTPGVKDLLWRAVRAQRAAAGPGLGDSAVYDTRLERDAEWFAAGYSTDEPERFSGHHAADLLLVIDEASGVAEDIFEAAEGFLTSEDTKVLLIGNPTQLAGQFHRAFHKERAEWKTIHISAFDAPCMTGEPVSEDARRRLISQGWIEQRARMWGEDSAAYQVRVLGDFPKKTDDTVISLADVEAAQQRSLPAAGRNVIACDVARFGSDETVIVERRGPQARIVGAYHGQDLMGTVGRVVRAARELDSPETRPVIIVDDVGLGGGVVDRLRELNEFPVIAFNGGSTAHVDDDYPNRRSEVWFSFAEQLPGIDLGGDEQLAADLVAPRYKLDSRGRRVVEPKSETKKRLKRSPDRADAVLMAFAVPAKFEFAQLGDPEPLLSIDVARGDLW